MLMPTLFMSVLEVYFHILFYCTSEAKQTRSQFYLEEWGSVINYCYLLLKEIRE